MNPVGRVELELINPMSLPPPAKPDGSDLAGNISTVHNIILYINNT